MSTAPITRERGGVFIPANSGNDTIFSKVQIVHRLIDNLFNSFPIAAPLYELVNVLPRKRMCFFVSHIKYPRQISISSPPVDMHHRNGLRHGRFARGPLRLPR
jgi:hypothetical protein